MLTFGRASSNGAIPCFAVLFKAQNGETSIRQPYNTKQKSFLSIDSSEEARKQLFRAGVGGLLSTSEEPNEETFFDTISFDSYPEVHGALLQVFFKCYPQ